MTWLGTVTLNNVFEHAQYLEYHKIMLFEPRQRTISQRSNVMQNWLQANCLGSMKLPGFKSTGPYGGHLS